MPFDTPASELVRQLRRVGIRPPERIIDRILEYGAVARIPLVELATSVDVLQEPEPDCWGPVHALRLLGDLPDTTIIASLLSVVPITIYDKHDTPSNLWATEVLQIIGRCGAPAYPLLWEWVNNVEHNEASRGAAFHALTHIVVVAPELRDTLITDVRSYLEQEHSPSLVAALISVLAELGVVEDYKNIMACYRAGRVDREKFPPGIARQLLLGGGQPLIEDVQTSFWERYEYFGPFPSDDQ